MYLFEKCPFQVDPPQDERACFDPGFRNCFKRHPDIVHHYCQGDFRGCPYYTTKGVSSRIPETAKPRALNIPGGKPGATRRGFERE